MIEDGYNQAIYQFSVFLTSICNSAAWHTVDEGMCPHVLSHFQDREIEASTNLSSFRGSIEVGNLILRYQVI